VSDFVFHQKLLHKIRRNALAIIVGKKPTTIRPKMRPFILYRVTLFFQYFNVKFFVDRLTCWSVFMVRDTFVIKEKQSKTQVGYFWDRPRMLGAEAPAVH